MNFSEKDINEALSKSSLVGLAVLYLVHLSFSKKIGFNYANTFKKLIPYAKDYCFGYLVAMQSVHLIDYNERNEIITVTHVESILASKIENALHARAGDDKDHAQLIEDIEDYFI